MSKTNSTKGKMYTAFIVRDANARKFLNQKIYTGRQPGIWGRLAEAQIFYKPEQAQACASNINNRRPSRHSAYFAEVVPVKVRGRGTTV
jgi:hypothetical protein